MEKKPFILKKKMIFDFSADVSYEEFLEKFKNINISFNLTVSDFNDDKLSERAIRELTSFQSLFGYQYEIIDEYKYTVNSLEYLLYKIFGSRALMDIPVERLTLMRDLFKGDIEERYRAKQSLAQMMLDVIIKDDPDSFSLWLYLSYIKVNSDKRFEKVPDLRLGEDEKMAYKLLKDTEEKSIEAHKPSKLFIAGYNKIHFSLNKIPNYNIHYLVFSVLFMSKELFLVYTGEGRYDIAKIIDKEKLNIYLDKGCTIINISTIIRQIFEKHISKEFLDNREKKKSRDLLLNDMQEMTKQTGNVKIQIEIKNKIPEFMSGKMQSNKVALYKDFKEYVGDFGEVTQVMKGGIPRVIKAKKKILYNKLKK